MPSGTGLPGPGFTLLRHGSTTSSSGQSETKASLTLLLPVWAAIIAAFASAGVAWWNNRALNSPERICALVLVEAAKQANVEEALAKLRRSGLVPPPRYDGVATCRFN